MERVMSCSCGCGEGPKLVFSCSGSADVGALADQAARKMTKDGTGKMFCLAGVGGKVPGIMKITQSSSDILAIDGCSLDCVKHCLQEAGFNSFKHLRLTDEGFTKGETELTGPAIETVAKMGANLLS